MPERSSAVQKAADMCPHGNFQNSCETCVQEEEEIPQDEGALHTMETDRTQREIGELMKRHGVFFVHAMQEEAQTPWSGGLHRGVDWFAQLKILLALEPTLSTSTIKEDDTERNFWASIGVILSSGSILGGGASDIGSVGRGRRERNFGKSVGGARRDIEGIQRAITAKARDSYNELVVENPKIAGFFVLINEAGFPAGHTIHPPCEEIFQKLKTLHIPIFAITRGKIYRIHGFDNTKGVIMKDEKPVPLAEIAQKPFELSGAQKEKMKDEFLLDPPFVCESPEALYIQMRAQGQEMYIELNAQTVLSRAQQKEEIREFDFEVTRTASESLRTRYFIRNGTLLKEGERKHQKGSHYQCQIDAQPHFPPFAFEKADPLERASIRNNEEYLFVMEQALPKLREEGKSEKLDRWAFHLYGFAEEARRFGDHNIAHQAETLADQRLSKKQYSNVVHRRLDAQGRFRITREELEGESKNPVARAA